MCQRYDCFECCCSRTAHSIQERRRCIDRKKGEPKVSAIIQVIRQYIKECKPIRFDGNGYSDEWKEEALRRGLDCETSCPLIFDNYLKPETIHMFESTGVMNRKELAARNEVKWEMYTKKDTNRSTCSRRLSNESCGSCCY